MAVIEPQGFNFSTIQYTPTFDVQELDLTQFDNYADDLIELENDRLDNIEKNYNSLMDTKDALLGLDPGSVYGKSVIDRKRKEYDITDDVFNFSMDDLRNPFLHRQIKSNLTGLINDQEVKNAMLEGQEIQKFDQYIRTLERKDPGMALVAKRDLNKVRTDPTGQFNIYGLQPEDYQKIDFAELLSTELDGLPKNTKITSDNQGNGYIIFNETENFNMTGDEFAEYVADKYGDDPRVINTFRSQIDPTKPESERSINDPDAVEKYLKSEAEKVYKNYQGLTTKSTVKEDKAFTEQLKHQYKTLFDNIQTENDIRLKTTTPGKNTTPTGVYKEGQTQVFDSKTYGNAGSVIGNKLSQDGYVVDPEQLIMLNEAVKNKLNPQRVENADGSVAYTYVDKMGRTQVIARFDKIPVTEGFIGTGIEERYLNGNPVLRRKGPADRNLALIVLRNQDVRGRDGFSLGSLQDVFFDEIVYPQYAAEKAKIESDPDLAKKAQDLGLYGNKLFYLLHHNGYQGTLDYINNGGTAYIKGNVNSDAEIDGAFKRAEATYGDQWDNVPTGEYIKWLESRGNPAALYTGDQNSSAFGAYQFTLTHWGDPLREFIAERIPNYGQYVGLAPAGQGTTQTPQATQGETNDFFGDDFFKDNTVDVQNPTITSEPAQANNVDNNAPQITTPIDITGVGEGDLYIDATADIDKSLNPQQTEAEEVVNTQTTPSGNIVHDYSNLISGEYSIRDKSLDTIKVGDTISVNLDDIEMSIVKRGDDDYIHNGKKLSKKQVVDLLNKTQDEYFVKANNNKTKRQAHDDSFLGGGTKTLDGYSTPALRDFLIKDPGINFDKDVPPAYLSYEAAINNDINVDDLENTLILLESLRSKATKDSSKEKIDNTIAKLKYYPYAYMFVNNAFESVKEYKNEGDDQAALRLFNDTYLKASAYPYLKKILDKFKQSNYKMDNPLKVYSTDDLKISDADIETWKNLGIY